MSRANLKQVKHDWTPANKDISGQIDCRIDYLTDCGHDNWNRLTEKNWNRLTETGWTKPLCDNQLESLKVIQCKKTDQ